jgi:hypothetical protein
MGLLSLLIVLVAIVAKGQQGGYYIPSSQTYSTTSIANFVQSNFKTNREKLSAIYAWVTANIRYDKDSMYNINWGTEPNEKVSATLRRRKGVCENFAAIFTDICLKSNIPSFAITGYTRQSGSVKRIGHSWSAVYLDKEWLLCDPTWDAGSGNGNNYFLVSPDQFIESHMPFDPLWQLLPFPITQQEFSSGHLYAKRETPAWNIGDSVLSFLQLDSLQQLEASLLRMKKAGVDNDMVKIWRSYLDMKIAIVYGDKDMNLYNEAVADLNRATKIFNAFVQYRNNRFLPVKSDAEMNGLLTPIAGILTLANKKLENIGREVENFQYDTGALKIRLAGLRERVKEQQKFLNNYLESGVADRGKLFYK